MLSKNDRNKKCASKLLSIKEKKIEKDSDDFWHWKFDFESQMLAIFETFSLHQFSKLNNFLLVCWFLGNFFWNSTTRIAIKYVRLQKGIGPILHYVPLHSFKSAQFRLAPQLSCLSRPWQKCFFGAVHKWRHHFSSSFWPFPPPRYPFCII